MITDSIYKRYNPGVIMPLEVEKSSLWFVYSRNKLLVKATEEKACIPVFDELGTLYSNIKEALYLGEWDEFPCYCAEILEDTESPANMELRELRPLFGRMEDDLFLLAGRAFQIINWNRNTRFCGKCGAATELKKEERAKCCPVCGLHSYPNVVPAIIVAVRKGDQLLLAHANHFPSELYSVVAGFIEAGETFEECVRREVMEEIGIKVKNIQYFGSQPWPFPNSIMVAFTAEYDEGEIKVDGVEIGDAGWFRKDNLPALPGGYSIARALIEWFIESGD